MKTEKGQETPARTQLGATTVLGTVQWHILAEENLKDIKWFLKNLIETYEKLPQKLTIKT